MNQKPEVRKEGAYLYSLWSGRFVSYEGDVYVMRGNACSLFKTKTKRFICANEPQVIYNSMVWLPEKDDTLAKEILIQYQEESIIALQEKIDNHLNKIKILKGENK